MQILSHSLKHETLPKFIHNYTPLYHVPNTTLDARTEYYFPITVHDVNLLWQFCDIPNTQFLSRNFVD